MLVRDASVNRVLLGPISWFQSQGLLSVAGQLPVLLASEIESAEPEPKADKQTKEAKEKIPRPPNAFILYRKDHHERMVKKHPETHNNHICKLTMILL
jgi:hypothetical protein